MVKAVVAVALLAAGCAGRDSGRLALTHVELLTALARKGVDLVANGRLTAESMPELTYPLERAQAFAASEEARDGDRPPPSRAAFRAFVDRYREFVDTLDRVRRERTGAAARDALAPALAAVEGAGEAVHAALHDAGRGGGAAPASLASRGCTPDPSGRSPGIGSACPADGIPSDSATPR